MTAAPEGPAGDRAGPRILLVTNYYPAHGGGVEIVAGQLAVRLARRGVRCEWAACGGPAEVPRRPEPGIDPLPLPAWNVTERRLGFPYPLPGPAGLSRLRRAVARADLVHLHDSLYAGNVAAARWAQRRRKPVVVTQHIGLVPYQNRVVRWLHSTANRTLGRHVLGSATRPVFLGPKVRDYFAGFVRFRAEPLLIPNGVDTDLFTPVSREERRALRRQLGLPESEPVMLFVGRFVEKKGLGLLREMAARFAARRWVFVGRGPADPAGWGLPNVVCPGQIRHEETRDWYRAADLLVLPSVGEGFPLVVQEAMACGLPVLISRDTARGAADVESVARVADLDPGSLAAGLEAALDDPGEHQRRRRASAEFARRHWTWERCVERYLEVYRAILESAP